MDFEEFKAAHEKYRFQAAILVHLYGWTSAALVEFRQFCKTREIALIEDGAQAYGVRWKGDRSSKGRASRPCLSIRLKFWAGRWTEEPWSHRIRNSPKVVARSPITDVLDTIAILRPGWNSRMGGLQASFSK